MRLIDADVLIKILRNRWCGEKCIEWSRANCTSTYCFIKCIENDIEELLPIIEPQRETGHWIDKFAGVYRCSNCREVFSENDIVDKTIKNFNFCPNCGAYMREGESE